MKIIYSYLAYLGLLIAVITKGYALRHSYGVMLASVSVAVITDFCTLLIPFAFYNFIRGKNNIFLKSFGVLFVLLYFTIYLLDTLLLLGLNARLNLSAMNYNGLEWPVAFTFLKEKYQVVIICSIILSILLFFKVSRKGLRSHFYRTCIPILMILCGSNYSNIYSKYSFNPLYLIFTPFQGVQGSIVNDTYELQKAYEKVTSESFKLPAFNKNIILLVVESLSAVDSKRMGGMYDRLAELDELSKKGIIFTNYYANHFNSEGGFIGMLCGVPPVSYPGYTALGYRDHPCFMSNLVRELKKNEYLTEFLTTGNLAYAQKGTYMKSLGFDRVRGRAEVQEFRNAEWYAFDAPADSVLYAEALKTIDSYKKEKQRFFLNLFTVSSHRPYYSPKDGGDTIESIFSYVGSEIVNFYNLLDQKGFFNDGILIVVGDHRRMDVIPEEEFKVLGEKARNWVWLGLFGSGISPKVIGENISQHALISNILKVASGGVPRSTDKVVFTNPWDQTIKGKSGIIDLNNGKLTDGDSSELSIFRQASFFIRHSRKHPCDKFERDIDDLGMVNGIGANVFGMTKIETLSREEAFIEPNGSYSSFKEAIENNVSYVLPNLIHVQADVNLNMQERTFLTVQSKSSTCLFIDGKLQAVTDEGGVRFTALPTAVEVSGNKLLHIDFIAELNPFADTPQIEYLTNSGNRGQIDVRYANSQPEMKYQD